MNVVHVLKTDPVWFQRVVDGSKTYEVRLNDRNFQKGDQVHLMEWNEIGGRTGRDWFGYVGDVFSGGYGCEPRRVRRLLPTARVPGVTVWWALPGGSVVHRHRECVGKFWREAFSLDDPSGWPICKRCDQRYDAQRRKVG